MTNLVCGRSFPDLLGIVLWYGKLGIWRISGHCDKVAHTGVAISRIEEPFIMDEFRKDAEKTVRMTIEYLKVDGDSHTT